MDTQKVRTCFTITYSQEQFEHAKAYVNDMRKHPNRVYWRGKEGKDDTELIIEQIAHRILSGFYNDNPYQAGKHIIRMDSAVTV
jgi:tripartite-type tricarboxylate transporter receptor subunit TctC